MHGTKDRCPLNTGPQRQTGLRNHITAHIYRIPYSSFIVDQLLLKSHILQYITVYYSASAYFQHINGNSVSVLYKNTNYSSIRTSCSRPCTRPLTALIQNAGGLPILLSSLLPLLSTSLLLCLAEHYLKCHCANKLPFKTFLEKQIFRFRHFAQMTPSKVRKYKEVTSPLSNPFTTGAYFNQWRAT